MINVNEAGVIPNPALMQVGPPAIVASAR